MRWGGWHRINTGVHRNTQRRDASAHVLRAETLINPMDRLASVSHEAHRLGLAHVRSAQTRDDGNPRAMETQVLQTNFPKKARPFTSSLRAKIKGSFAAFRFESGDQRDKAVMEFRGERLPAFHIESDFHSVQVDPRKWKASFRGSAALVNGDFKAGSHPFGTRFQSSSNERNFRVGDFRLFARGSFFESKADAGIRCRKAPPDRFGHQETEYFEFPDCRHTGRPIETLRAWFLSPLDVIGRVLVGELGGVGDASGFEIDAQRFPSALVAQQGLRLGRVVVIQEFRYPRFPRRMLFGNGCPVLGPGLLAANLACPPHVGADADAAFRRFPFDFAGGGIAEFHPPKFGVQTFVERGHCVPRCALTLQKDQHPFCNALCNPKTSSESTEPWVRIPTLPPLGQGAHNRSSERRSGAPWPNGDGVELELSVRLRNA